MNSVLILARAGGGSGGFGGGGFGGGGRGGGFSGGRGHGIIFVGGGGGGGFGLVLIALIVVAVVLFLAVGAVFVIRERRRREARVRRVELASAEAAEDDPAFEKDRVHADAGALFAEMESAWDARDRERLRHICGPELWTEWERRLDDLAARGWHNRVAVLGGPQIEYVGLVNRTDDAEDRVVVRITALLDDYVEDSYGSKMLHTGQTSTHTTMCEYWTLGKSAGRWMLLSIEQRAEGEHELDEQIVASPWSDGGRLRDEALVEGAVAERAPAGFATAEIADLDFAGSARAAALDLALADGRFAPDVLEVAARRAVSAWADGIDGNRSALTALASPAVVRELLHPGDPSERTRLVVRGLRIERVAITQLDAAVQPPTMSLELAVSGRRYIEDRDTTSVLDGDPNRERRWALQWKLALREDDAQPWWIVAAG
ncbi:MAG: TIM44-like domain-containing protein [Solirubrobacteraceae bacterium]